MNHHQIPRTERDHVLVDVKANAFGGLRPALTPTPGAVPERRAGYRPTKEIHKFRSSRFQGIAVPSFVAPGPGRVAMSDRHVRPGVDVVAVTFAPLDGLNRDFAAGKCIDVLVGCEEA